MTTAKVDDKKFARDAAENGLIEVELSKLAMQKTSRDDIKQFAEKMVDDYSKVNDQLKEVAAKENIQIPDSTDNKHQSRVDRLGKLSGDEFDKAYIKDQVKEQQATVRDFNAEAQSGADPNVKAFASNRLPALQSHLDEAKNLSKSEKNMAKQAKGQ